MPFDPTIAIRLIEAERNNLGADEAARDAYIKEAKARLGLRSADDHKEATKLAVETAKQFMTIALAILAATVALIQFSRTNGLDWVSIPMGLFGTTALLLVLSMITGFNAISGAYKRADGRIDETLPAWSTAPLAPKLGLQGQFGLGAIASLVVGLAFWANASVNPTAAVAISIPSSQGQTTAKGPVTITGNWTDLLIRTAGNQELKLPQGSGPIQLICK